jgi:hypothetical protein
MVFGFSHMVTVSIARPIPMLTITKQYINHTVNSAISPVRYETHVVMRFSQEILHLVICIINRPWNVQSVGIVGKGFGE